MTRSAQVSTAQDRVLSTAPEPDQGVGVFVAVRITVTLALLFGCGAPAPVPPPPTEAPRAEAPQTEAPAEATVLPIATRGPRLRTAPIERDGVSIPRAIVCLPAEAMRDGARRFPVLYALDGDYFVESLGLCDLVASLVREGAIEPWVVVAIPSTEQRTDTLARRSEDLGALVIEELEPQPM